MMKTGIIFALLTALLSGISIFTNGLFVTKVNPVVFVFLRNLLVGFIFTMLLIVGGYQPKIWKIAKPDWLKLLGIGMIGGGLPFGLFFLGLSQTGPVTGNILNKTLFLWVALLAVPFLKEKLHWVTIIGYGIVFFSLFWGQKIVFSTGALLVLTASVMWAIEHVIAKKVLPRVDPIILAWSRMLFGLPILFLFAFLTWETPVITTGFLGAISVSSGLLVAYMFVWYSAIRYAPVTLVSSLLVLAPIVTMILSAGILQKPIPANQVYSSILLIIGVFLITISLWFKRESSYRDYGH